MVTHAKQWKNNNNRSKYFQTYQIINTYCFDYGHSPSDSKLAHMFLDYIYVISHIHMLLFLLQFHFQLACQIEPLNPCYYVSLGK